MALDVVVSKFDEVKKFFDSGDPEESNESGRKASEIWGFQTENEPDR